MAHVDRRDQTQIDTLAADLSLKPAGLVAAMDSSESGAGGQTPGAGLVAASSESGAAGAGGQTPGAGLVAAMDSSESGAGGQTPGPRGEKRPSEVASEVARDTCFFSDWKNGSARVSGLTALHITRWYVQTLGELRMTVWKHRFRAA